MRFTEISESTTAGSVSTVAMPLGGVQSRTQVAGLEPAEKVMRGKIKKKVRLQISESELGNKYGTRATVVQFSTTFCSECRAAKALISDVVSNENEIAYIEIDAESNLELVRKVDIRSTPTTLFLDKAGFEIARATGAPKRDQLIKVIASL
jgi:thiol-disulfide isomerase/thioredoxin